MTALTIPPQNCRRCGKDSGTLIVCDECRVNLTRSQIIAMDRVYQLFVIELFNCCCVDCGHSAPAESGELAADHGETKGAHPELRYDAANGFCRCLKCHDKRHKGEIKKVPPAEKLPKETREKQEKFKKLPVCSIMGCIASALPNGKKPKNCWKHQ